VLINIIELRDNELVMYIWNLLKEKKGGGGEERKER